MVTSEREDKCLLKKHALELSNLHGSFETGKE